MIARCLVAALITGLAGAAGGTWWGVDEGLARAQAASDHKAVNDLVGLIDAHKDLTSQAVQVSKQLRTAAAKRAAHDAQATQEFKDALARTSDSRAGCVFPADVMQQLAAARDRAAAAGAGGTGATVPGAGGTTDPR